MKQQYDSIHAVDIVYKTSIFTIQGKDDDYEVVSLIPMDDLDSRDRSSGCSFYLSPTTLVTYIARRYRMAFVLDASPSLASLVSCCH